MSHTYIDAAQEQWPNEEKETCPDCYEIGVIRNPQSPKLVDLCLRHASVAKLEAEIALLRKTLNVKQALLASLQGHCDGLALNVRNLGRKLSGISSPEHTVCACANIRMFDARGLHDARCPISPDYRKTKTSASEASD